MNFLINLGLANKNPASCNFSCNYYTYHLLVRQDMRNLRLLLTIIVTGSFVITTDSAEVKKFPELKKRSFASESLQQEQDFEGISQEICECVGEKCIACPVGICCLSSSNIWKCCQDGTVCCPEGCCPVETAYCCPNGPYCCPPTATACYIESQLCCLDESECCPGGCCEYGETCCGKECCNNEQQCCEDSNGGKFCCAESAKCCNDKCCGDTTQCCDKFNSVDQKMEKSCEKKPEKSSMNSTKYRFHLSDSTNTSKISSKPDIMIKTFAVGQGDCTMITCPDGDLVIIDMGSSSGTSFKGPEINSELTNYFSNNPTYKMRIIVTHPDRDHYSLFETGLDSLIHKVEYFILSGVYEEYSTFKDWLETNFGVNQILLINEEQECYGNAGCILMPAGETSPVIDPNSLCNNNPDVSWTILAANLGRTKNSQSAVIKLTYNDSPYSTVLFSGDFETVDAQADLINEYAGTDELKSVFYKMAHHGASRLANDIELLEAIKPEFAFVSQAYPASFYAHPRCRAIFGLLALYTIHEVDPDTDNHSPFACGTEPHTPLVFYSWCHAIFATCREPHQCYHIEISLGPDGDHGVEYIGPIPVPQVSDEAPDPTLHIEL